MMRSNVLCTLKMMVTKGETTVAGGVTGPIIDEKQQVLSKTFSGRGLCAGSSGDVSTSYSYIPPIDCDKIAKNLRYLKEKRGKGKLPMGMK